MKTIRYTDQHRYPHGYRKAAETDIQATFKRARQQHAKNAQEVASKVKSFKVAK